MTVEQFTDALIRGAIVALLVVAALRVFSPFMELMPWALILAGIMMAFGRSGSDVVNHILCRIAGSEQGSRVHALVTMTARSVAAP